MADGSILPYLHGALSHSVACTEDIPLCGVVSQVIVLSLEIPWLFCITLDTVNSTILFWYHWDTIIIFFIISILNEFLDFMVSF